MEQQLVGIERPGEAQEAHQTGYDYEDNGDHLLPDKWNHFVLNLLLVILVAGQAFF